MCREYSQGQYTVVEQVLCVFCFCFVFHLSFNIVDSPPENPTASTRASCIQVQRKSYQLSDWYGGLDRITGVNPHNITYM